VVPIDEPPNELAERIIAALDLSPARARPD